MKIKLLSILTILVFNITLTNRRLFREIYKKKVPEYHHNLWIQRAGIYKLITEHEAKNADLSDIDIFEPDDDKNIVHLLVVLARLRRKERAHWFFTPTKRCSTFLTSKRIREIKENKFIKK